MTAALTAPAFVIPDVDDVYTDIPEDAYHADRGSLSSSGARRLLQPSCPEIFDYERDHRPDPKAQYDFGHAAHKYLLGIGEEIVEVAASDWRTKAAQEARREAWDAGKVPMLTEQVAKAKAMAHRAAQHPWVASLLSAGEAEVSGYWHDEPTGTRLRLRADWIHPGVEQLIIGDYKTSTSAHPYKFSKSCGDYGYHQQAAWYLDGLAALDYSARNGYGLPPAFLFIFQSKEPPFPVSVGELDLSDLERARGLNRRAIDLYAECVAANRWPDYGTGIHRLSVPNSQRYREQEFLA